MSKFHFWTNLLLVTLSVALPATGQEVKRRSAAFWFRSGEVQLERHNWTAARDAFDACLREDPTYTDAYYSRAMVHEHFDSLNRALTDYNIYLEFRPEHHEALFARSQVRQRLGQYELARGDLLRLLTLPPGATTAIVFRQNVYTGTVDQAFTAKGSDKGYIFNALGVVESKLGNYDQAIVYYDSALKINPQDPDVLVNRGAAHELRADTLDAILDYQRALKYNPQHAIARHNLSSISKGKNKEGPDAKLLDEAVDDNPNLPFAWAERAYDRFQKGRYADALADYDRAIELDARQPEYFLNRGLIREKLKDPEGAYSDYTAAIRIHNTFEKAWLNRGNLLARLGRLNEAVEDYSVAITHSPDYAAAFYNRAMVLARLKQRDLACADLNSAERLGRPVEPKVWKNICGR